MTPRSSPLASVLAVVAGLVMATAYFTPVWWVSLTAPNYPVDRFPDGIRIHFGFEGVSNGCTTAAKTSRVAQETQQEDLGWRSDEEKPAPEKKSAESGGALDCVHEMNTINHYVGMRPIGVGAPVERNLSRYILGMFGVMILGFALRNRRARVVTLGAGFGVVAAWMVVDQFVRGRLAAVVTEYTEEAGKYFREAEKITAWGETLHTVAVAVVLVLIALMAFMVFAAWRWHGFQLALGIVPALLPLFFVAAYAAWLWFFGHTMHPWGAFTLKPFMPTVFGDGMVAQFSTHSYPHYGFGLLALSSVLLLVAVARRRLELMDEPAAPVAG
ncbi:MAG: hypothetical protein HY904_16910 [Deltaproteobacteria bacterium]|nr:hypothetical protein [Deltaproteobacteria bacterium]